MTVGLHAQSEMNEGGRLPRMRTYRAGGEPWDSPYHQAALDAPHFDRARLSLEFVVPDNRRRDVANYLGAFKPGIDALVDVGLIPDDDHLHLQIGALTMRVAAKGEQSGVNVLLEELTDHA
jgi:hypothetical protein